jgi:hypothetical protein
MAARSVASVTHAAPGRDRRRSCPGPMTHHRGTPAWRPRLRRSAPDAAARRRRPRRDSGADPGQDPCICMPSVSWLSYLGRCLSERECGSGLCCGTLPILFYASLVAFSLAALCWHLIRRAVPHWLECSVVISLQIRV